MWHDRALTWLVVLSSLSLSSACQSPPERPSVDSASTTAPAPPASAVAVTSATATQTASAQPAPAQDQIDKRVSAEPHTAFFGPVASLESLCKEVNDDYAKHVKPAVAICTPGAKKPLTGGPVQEIGFYTVALPRSSSDVFLAVRTAKGWFVQKRTFGSEPAGGGISHHTPVVESIPLERARQTSAGLFAVHVHQVNTYMPGMGNMGRSETVTVREIHCIVDAQGTPSCTDAVAVTSRHCNDPELSDAGCSEENLLGGTAAQ